MYSRLWEHLGNFNNVLGLFTFFFATYAAYRLRRDARRRAEQARHFKPVTDLEEIIQRHEGIQSDNPVALAICLLPQQDRIRDAVDTFLRVQNWKMPVREINLDGINDRSDMISFAKALFTARRELADEGCTEVHLFFAGPGAAAPLVGSAFVNWVPVKLYHKPSVPEPQIYRYWMPLIR